MNTNKLLLSGVAGGVAFFLLGFLVYGVLLMKFFEANAGTATGVMKEPMDWWALILGNLAWGFLLAVIFVRWANISTFATGLRAGAIIGLLTGLSFDLMIYGTSNLSNLTGTIVDVLIFTALSAVAGGVVGLVIGMGKSNS
ncbi:MAG TPA: hypothetical protein PKC76_19180 [Saprospiraceae bacterium]|nr:hypothetical protein [Saprospiraceae bacterium]HMP26260.1 hypothetical protein [Saprospiraceae bacterium]